RRAPASLFGETVRQAGMLFTAQTGSLAAGLLVSLIQARWMEPAEMGRFAFCIAIIVVGGVFFDFGLFSAGARVLALEHDEEGQRRALGALVILAVIIGVGFTAFIAAASLPVDAIFKKDVHWLLLGTAALAFFQPFQYFIELGCQGLNRIRLLSVFQLLMSGAYLLALAALAASHHLNAGLALAAYLVGIAVATVWTVARLRPSFKGATPYLRTTLRQAREYGMNLYFARITGVASSRADQLVIAYFLTDAAPLGIYAIVQKFANPIMMIGRSVALTRFRAFAQLPRVPGRLTRWSAVMLTSAALGLILIGPLAIHVLFPRYSAGAGLLVPFALANLFAGLFQPYNIFLASHGRGAEVRNIAAAVAVSSLVGLSITIPRYGISGAAWTATAVMALDYLLHLYYYQRFKRVLSSRIDGETTDGRDH
ncbi:MAG TPA: lipopolysaccharide biosynthesis protein, partial [Blastocatellia bacterium]|nr:lipopolysaccharide biosynthesis protein [Blastocatellia bacterium]